MTYYVPSWAAPCPVFICSVNLEQSRVDIDKDDLAFLAIDNIIMMPKSKPIILGVGYRPHRDNMFYAKLEEVLSSCTNFVKQECYILGDFNTDVLAESNVLKNDFENF